MNPDTGAIAQFETKKDAEAAGHTVQLTPEQAAMLLPMTRTERREWARRQIRTSKLKVLIDQGKMR